MTAPLAEERTFDVIDPNGVRKDTLGEGIGSMLTSKANEQVRKLLKYVAASGSAALVNTKSGVIVATDGMDDSAGLIEELRALDLRRDSVKEEVPGVSVGQVGNSYLLVVKEEIRVECSELLARIEKASDMLTNILGKSSERAAAQFEPWMKEE